MKNLFSYFTIFLMFLFLTSCGNKASGDTAEAGAAGTVAEASAGSVEFTVQPTASQLTWEGYKPGTTHTGTVNVSGGSIQAVGGKLESGSFTLDMTSITDTDLEPGKGKEKLEAHLKGTTEGKENDFFNVTQHPTGMFEITKVVDLQNDPDANSMIYGNLTLKGITKSIAFRANVDITNGKLTASTPMFKIDRTEWDLKFRSKNFFDNLGDNFIQDEFGVAVRLAASAPAG